MPAKVVVSITIFILILASICGLTALTSYYSELPDKIGQHETIVLGQSRLVPGSWAALRVVVRDSKDGSLLPGAEVRVSLRSSEGDSGKPATLLYKGRTDERGSVDVSFKVPRDAAPSQVLQIETTSSLGSDRVERPVTVERNYRVLLTTDKPLYQPGQVIHVRALALSAFDLVPAVGQELEIAIADGKGNWVFRKKLATSDYGVAATDFQLAEEVNTGPYKISAVLGNTSSEKTVTVEHYVLPKFAVTLDTERPYYRPGEVVRGSLEAGYFFGKPVAGGQVALEGYTFDVQRNLAFTLQGSTDESGKYEFEFSLPDYIAGSELEGGLGRFYLQAAVTDQARHTEVSNLSLPVAQDSLVIEAVPEAGQFRPGVENILYVLTSYPDGTPAESSLTIDLYDVGQTLQAGTGPYGLAEVRFTPANPYVSLIIQAHDSSGNTAQREFYFEGEYNDESILLRPDRPVYQVGEAMTLTILASQPGGTAYLDIVREGQTVSTRSVEISNGRAEVAVDLTPDLFGTLELHAYKILSWGGITRDTRLVVVENAAGLDLSLATDREVYRPGEQAGLDVQVSDKSNQAGVQSALGIAIVDESVFALAEQDPGFAKLYFLLEQEILTPRYDLHGFSIPDLVGGAPLEDKSLAAAVEDTARASLAAMAYDTAGPGASIFSLQANSHEDAMRRAYDIQARYFGGMSTGLYYLILLLPLGVLALSAFAIRREGRLGDSLVLALLLIVLPLAVFLLWPLGENYNWVQTPLDRLSVVMDWLSWRGQGLLLILALGGVLGYLALIGIAVQRRNALLGWSLFLLVLFLVIFGFLSYAVSRSNLSPGTTTVAWGMAAYALIPFAFLLLFSAFALKRRLLAALAALLVAGFFSLVAIPVMAIGMGGGMAFGAMAPALQGVDRGMVVEEALPMAAAPMPTAAVEKAVLEAPDEVEEAPSAAEPPRLRQYFPETMLWLPDAITDENGQLHLDFPMADSITTWRMTVLASSQDGRLGSTTAGLRVFQDFFIDLDLPVALTAGDEVSIPVGVFNYLPEAQTVRLDLEQSGWFELLDEPMKEIEIAANEISVVYFRVKAVQFGLQPFKVTAIGSRMSDAIQKEVRVFPNGKSIYTSYSDRLTPGQTVRQAVLVPTEAIPGTQRLMVRIYPGIISQVVEGLDTILRMPFGCFEQTSSTTYPNVLVLDYLKTTNQASPETQMKAEEYVNLGYQRLVTFEVGGSGGFSLFGDPPADRMLTAYGLQEFSDMSRVYDVDPALLNRTAEWLLSQQAGDGSWENDRGLVHEQAWASLGNDRLPVTAYIVWSLVEAGFIDDERTQKGLEYVHEGQSKAEDAYVLALVANALVSANLAEGAGLDPSTQAVLDRLTGLAIQDGNTAYWKSSIATFMGAEGYTGSIETTALAALALLRSGTHPELANAGLTYLVRQKDDFGTWYSTQATVMALKALIQSVRAGAEQVDATVAITLNGSQERNLQVSPENFDVVQMVSFDDVNPGKENLVEIRVEGKGNLMYQVTGSYYLPWEALVLYPDLAEAEELVTIDVTYDRTELSVNDTVEVDVTIAMNQPGTAESALIDLGLPPGFSVLTEDLAGLVARFDDVPDDYQFPTIERYELTGRQILVYVSNLSYERPLQFSYRLRARFPLVAQSPSSSAYDYYNPEVSGAASPQILVVKP